MELTDQAMQTLAQLLSGLFDDNFHVYHGENEPDSICRRKFGDGIPEWIPVAEAFELLKQKHKKVSEVCNRADLFILLVNSGAAEK